MMCPAGSSNIRVVSRTTDHSVDDNYDRDDSNIESTPAPTTATPEAPAPLYPPDRVYSMEQLEVLNILVHPVWIFDLDNRCMRWANGAAVELWNANSLQELLNRNFGDMTEATVTRLLGYRATFSQGQRIYDQWTYYPKGEAKTVQVVGSGVRLSADEVNPSMLFEGTPACRDKLQPEQLRGIEMLRHLPVPVCQFDMAGKMMFQNPEASLDTSEREDTAEEAANKKGNSKDAGSSSSPDSIKPGDLLSRFADVDEGKEALRKIQLLEKEGGDAELTISVQAQIRTRNGPRWSAVQLRRTSDPVTGQPVILYNSRDLTDAMQAKEAREASIAKSEFLAIMAHEIRTPLHQVTGFIDLLDETELNNEQRSFVRLLKSSAKGLMTVINDVLDLSKLEAGKMKLESISYEPRSVLEGSMEAVRSTCEEKNLYLEKDCNKQIPFKVVGDPNRLRQVLLNLFSNAIKFTKKGGIKVQVIPETSEHGSRPMMKFIVSDTGMGISEEHQELIFNKYQQANVSVARNFGGTGLGLSICKLLIHNMGGSIGLTSQLGQGSSFWFTLPAEVPLELPEHAASFLPEDAADYAGGLHILVAEDNRVNQKLLASMLKRMGHTSELACNGKVAIDMIERKHYDVVLMDIQMPVMDGLEATRRIRSMGFTSLPILGLTASVARSDFTELGFSDWLPKPIPMRELKSKLYQIKRQKEQGGASSPRTLVKQ